MDALIELMRVQEALEDFKNGTISEMELGVLLNEIIAE